MLRAACTRASRVAAPRRVCAAVGARGIAKTTGLVGLANVGKSTLFNGLVKAQLAQAANFPFCTIEPNTAVVEVPDERLAALGALSKSEKVMGWQIEFHDIAGLVKGASQGAGLGNAFLGNIRAVNCIMHVVRCFDNPDIIHVMNNADAVRDVQVIETELILADLQSVEKRLASNKRVRTPEAVATQRLLQKCEEALQSGIACRFLDHTIDAADAEHWNKLQLLTQKPMLYVCNVNESDAAEGNAMTRAVQDYVTQAAAEASSSAGVPATVAAGTASAPMLSIVCAQLEAEAALLPEADRLEFLSAYQLPESGLNHIMRKAAALLKLQAYYTTGPMETRSWCIPVGTNAMNAAGAIHSDFVKGFIRAEVTAYDEYMAAGGEAAAKEAGKTRSEGKEYIMQEGDVVNFRIGNVK